MQDAQRTPSSMNSKQTQTNKPTPRPDSNCGKSGGSHSLQAGGGCRGGGGSMCPTRVVGKKQWGFEETHEGRGTLKKTGNGVIPRLFQNALLRCL